MAKKEYKEALLPRVPLEIRKLDSDMRIKEANQADAFAISELIRTSYMTVAETYGLNSDNCPKHPSNCTELWVQSDFNRGVRYFILESDTQLIGCVALEKASDERCYLERLAVIPTERHKGIGSMLVRYFIKIATIMGLKTIGIGIIANQTELKEWYEKIGFKRTDQTSFDHLPFEVVFMEYQI